MKHTLALFTALLLAPRAALHRLYEFPMIGKSGKRKLQLLELTEK